jgi:NADH-quinone oxidoreductase subunit J
MLTAQGPFISMKAGAAEWAISAVAGFFLFGVLAVTAWTFRDEKQKPAPPPGSVVAKYAPTAPLVEASKNGSAEPAARSQYSTIIGEGLLGVGVGPAHAEEVYRVGKQEAEPKEDGNILRMAYLLPFEIVSVHLLVVLIGAAYLARAKRHKREA